jgi:putative ABC transport system substrate-binding protein
MDRRSFIFLGATFVLAHDGFAQAKPLRVGLLGGGGPITDTGEWGAALIRGLAQRGYVLGRDYTFERRNAMARFDALPTLARELVAAKVNVILTWSYPAALAANGSGVPAVAAAGLGDPVATGLALSLAHPGGNITGVSDIAADLSAKRLELLKEAVPNLRRVAMLWNKGDLAMTNRYEVSASVAEKLGVTVQPLGVREPEDFGEAFSAMQRQMPDAILMVADPLTVLNRKLVFEFASRNRLPAIYEFDSLVRDGGLMSYGADQEEAMDRVASLVDHVLKGEKPADLPIELPARFKFAVNLKTARSIGLDLPPTTIARADEVVE